MKKIFMLLGCIITGLYAALYILVGMLAMIGSIYSDGERVNIQDMFLSLSTEGVVGFLVITQVTIVPLIAGWISKLLYKKYKSLK